MSKAIDLDSLATEYTTKLREAEQAVARYQKLLDSVRLLQQDQLGQVPPEVAGIVQAASTVGQAVGLLLLQRAARVAQLSAAIRREFPEVAANVKNLERSVAAALHYGYKNGRYTRERGLYRVRQR